MGKVKLSEAEEQRRFLRRIIESNMKRHDVDCSKLLKCTGTSRSTHYGRLRNPDSMTLRELKVYVKALQISDDDLLYAIRGEKKP